MLRKNLFVCVLALLGFPQLGWAVTYYVSHNGNDNAQGTSPAQAWRTLARAQQVTSSMGPGDAMLFERGGVYVGTLDLNGNGSVSQPIVFGAYGSGDDPIISGGVPVTGWVQHQGNIWRASLSTVPKYVLVNNEPATNARHPNSGWLFNAQGSQNTVSNNALAGFTTGPWSGATVVMRTENWRYENRTVTGMQNGTVTFTPNIGFNMGSQNWGFYLMNAMAALDSPGEWFYDASSAQLFLWAPNNANPNNLQVYASIHAKGFVPGWQKQNMRIENICFQGQTQCGISTEVSINVTVTNCTFRHLYKGISSSGTGHSYINNTFHDTYDAAIHLTSDQNDLVANNTLTDIAMVPGLGDSGWGYIGIRANGDGNIIRDNRLENVGYCGISVYGDNLLVERNVVINATSILNDGAGITFDEVDGLTVRDNIVLDMVGDLSTVALTHYAYYKITFGIYFGNSWVMNTLVEGNTVARCDGAGIHVDHTMMSTGNEVKNNVLYDNGVQLSLSDFSNNEGPGAVPPYFVPAFNTVYSGNVMYSVRPDQLCMRQMCVYGSTAVDWGTFSNNRYFSPYEEMSILRIIFPIGNVEKLFSLETWQQETGEDAGSTRSPLRQVPYQVTQVLGSNLLTNGAFDQNVSGWTGWPNEGQFTRDQTYLDNGAMRIHFSNPISHPSFYLHPDNMVNLQNGAYYRLKWSQQSSALGTMEIEFKAQSQLGSAGTMQRHRYPFDGERRDLTYIFQSDRTEPVRFQFINHYTESTYWVDNVELEQVQVVPLDPYDDHVLICNDQATPQTYPISGSWFFVDGQPVGSSVTLGAFRSVVIYRQPGTTGTGPGGGGGGTGLMANVLLGGATDWNTGTMRTDLVQQGYLPPVEPYTGWGISVTNLGATLSPAVLQATGIDRPVDWVYLELLNDDQSYSLAERIAAVVLADGRIVMPDGSDQLAFTASWQGRHLLVGHRNHLGVMTLDPLPSGTTVVDFTDPAVAVFGQSAMKEVNGWRGLWPGDVDRNGLVKYSGAQNDRDPILSQIGGGVPTAVVSGYWANDVNLDGQVKYAGQANDRDMVLNTIGGLVPTAVRSEQVP